MHRTFSSLTGAKVAALGVMAALLSFEHGVASISGPAGTSSSHDAAAPLVEPLDPSAFQVQPGVAAPRYYYGWGYQGYGYYYAAPVQQAAPAPAPAPRQAPSSRSSVGPGVRNWSTGRSSPLHRPWMKPM